MKYYEEMFSKYGFNDGGSIPDGAWEYRTAYVLIMNALLEKHGSNTRIAAFDRAGLHNCCMLLMLTVDEFSLLKKPATDGDNDFSHIAEQHDADDAYWAALSEAHMDWAPDESVLVETELDLDAIEDALNKIKSRT